VSCIFVGAAAAAPRLLVLWSFAVEQNALAFDAPSIAGERTVAANDTMAGNGDGKTVRGASSCHGADRRRCANAPRNLRIGDRRADWNLLEHLPHASLESSSAVGSWRWLAATACSQIAVAKLHGSGASTVSRSASRPPAVGQRDEPTLG
jgi:hypothetical protein